MIKNQPEKSALDILKIVEPETSPKNKWFRQLGLLSLLKGRTKRRVKK